MFYPAARYLLFRDGIVARDKCAVGCCCKAVRIVGRYDAAYQRTFRIIPPRRNYSTYLSRYGAAASGRHDERLLGFVDSIRYVADENHLVEFGIDIDPLLDELGVERIAIRSHRVLIGIGLRDLSRQFAVGIPPFECEAVVGDDGHRRAVVERQNTRVKGRGRPCLDLADGANTFQSSGRIVASLPIGIDRQQVVEIPREGLGVAVSVRVAYRNFVDQTGVGCRIYRSCDITYRNLV